MLTKRQNFEEVMKGGQPDRFVQQYEAFHIVLGNPINDINPQLGGPRIVNKWGVTKEWPAGTPGAFPVHTPETIVVKDIEHWRDYVHAPNPKFPESAWEPWIEQYEKIDRNEEYALHFIAPGVFEQCHYLCEIKNCMMYFITNPDEMHELIKYITEWELELAEQYCTYLHPDGVFQNDDWGSQISTFMSPDMFDEFYLDAYKQIYGYYIDHGAPMIVHHSDSYAATLVPEMIEMGIKVWQGVMTTNDVPALIAKYGPQITFMGAIDSGVIDTPDWSREVIEREVRRACEECGKLYFVPCGSQGLAMSTFPEVYGITSEMIDKVSKEMF